MALSFGAITPLRGNQIGRIEKVRIGLDKCDLTWLLITQSRIKNPSNTIDKFGFMNQFCILLDSTVPEREIHFIDTTVSSRYTGSVARLSSSL
jgi:hypothetical protein